MKRFLVPLLLTTGLLTACGSSSTAVTCKEQFWDGTVAVCLPAGWKVIDRETLTQREIPEEVIVAFQSEKTVSGQFPSVTVTREVLSQPVDSPAYSQASIRAVAVLPGYKLIDTRPVTIETKNLSIHVFTAQPIAEEPARRYYQVSAVSKDAGYTLTALTPVSVASTLEQEVLTIMKSFGFAEPIPAAK